MTPLEIKAALVAKGVKHVAIARQVGLSPQYVSDVIARNRRNADIENAIAVAIGRPIEEVFEPVAGPTSALSA